MISILILCVFLFVIILNIYQLFVSKHQDQISLIGIDYLIQQYLKKSYEKVSLGLIKHNSNNKKILSKDILKNEQPFIQEVKKSLISKLIQFHRCKEILSKINENISLSGNYNDLNLFLFPDIIIKDNHYYHYLLYYSSLVFAENVIDLDNEQSKLFLSNL